MSQEQGAALLAGVLSVAVFGWVYFVELRKTLRTCFRTSVFDVRGKLFDLFEEHHVSHDHEAHVSMRHLCNGLIEMVQVLHPFSLALLTLGIRKQLLAARRTPFDVRLDKALDALSDDSLKVEIKNLHRDLMKKLFLYLAVSSFIGLLFTVALVLRVWITGRLRYSKRHGSKDLRRQVYENGLRPVEERAEMFGDAEPALAF